MNARGFFAAARAANISLDGVSISDGALCFTNVPQERQDALNALLATFDSTKADEQDRIDGEIGDIENTITERRKREAVLTEAGRAWLAARDGEIAALRARRPR